MPMTPSSPLKSAMRMPGAPKRIITENPLSPTFREEEILEKHESQTEKQQAKDLLIKTRVRIAKVALRLTNFSCSLIVLAMISTTMRIFYATKHLPAQNNLPAWAVGTKTWPQLVVLIISCISLAFCLAIFWGYWRGGHKRAEKTAVYYTLFAVGFFIFSIVMWGIAAGILQGAKSGSSNKDIWGWSCVDNKRKELFQEKVDYALVCRLQVSSSSGNKLVERLLTVTKSWSLICCIIEVVVETLTILIYGIIFYRYYSKRKLRKSMDIRDRARSDLYLAQLRSQSAPNTPGFGPLSPSYSTHMKSPRFPDKAFTHMSDIEEGNGMSDADKHEPGTRFVEAKPPSSHSVKPFALQPPPIKVHAATPKSSQGAFSAFAPAPPAEYVRPTASSNEPAPVSKGEVVYDAVPIPGAYMSPTQTTFGHPPGHAS